MIFFGNDAYMRGARYVLRVEETTEGEQRGHSYT
jgi:hypothetical protein